MFLLSDAREGAAPSTAPGPAAIRREDYKPPAWWIDTVDLTIDLEPAKTRVLNRMSLRRNTEVPREPLQLHGDELTLSRVMLDGKGCSFKISGGLLVIENLPDGDEPFQLEIFTTCAPEKNTKLMGLYVSNDSFFTQCEAEGFRRITYFLDRPDVMASYSVTLRANKARYPVLLSNGNLVEHGDLEGAGNEGRHFAKWVDPHRKPSYLFALVAGKLVCREQPIKTKSGKQHLLQVYVRPGDLDKTQHAMDSLMASVAWDEARFGLSLDLDRFMIVATSDFNMGAMENKGLNIFNTKYVLANAATATDVDYANIESVVGHEYFHNWTGNRVTCRDWFQLSLKEGLTVFRDQEFSQDLAHEPSARAVKRIEDVRALRTMQFAEDAGPMAHPVRPDSYVEINNFYTLTVYEKGAEVVRMMQTLVGREGFAKGLTLYFERHDGHAVTCDDFAQAIADANPDSPLALHLDQFKRWYSQAGTPRVHASVQHDSQARSLRIDFVQSCPPTPQQPVKQPFVIPVNVGLVASDGAQVPLKLDADSPTIGTSHTVVLTGETRSVTFHDVAADAVPSLLRGFSAPVILDFGYSDEQLLTLLAHDADPFNRWEAGQRLALRLATNSIAVQDQYTRALPLNDAYIGAMRAVLRHPGLDAAFKELVLTLPSESYIAEQFHEVDPQRIHAVREAMRVQLATALRDDWVRAFEAHADNGSYSIDPVSAGRRALAGLALASLCLAARADVDAGTAGDPVWPGKTFQRFKDANNMTDRGSALSALIASGNPLAEQALAQFHAMFRDEPLVLDKWFALQAGATDRNGDVLPKVLELMRHPDFNLLNPNRARSLIFSFCSANPGAFHRADGKGYEFWADRVIELDPINPQVAARLARAMDRWMKLAEPYRAAACAAIERVAAQPNLSNDVREVVSRALSD